MKLNNYLFSIFVFFIVLIIYLVKDYLKRSSFFEKRKRDIKKYEVIRRPKSDFNINKILTKK